MSRTVLQIPINAALRQDAEKAALAQGFSSIQEFLRVVMKRLSLGKMQIAVEDEDAVQLSPRAARRYDKMYEDIKSGKEKTYKFTNVDALMKHLNE